MKTNNILYQNDFFHFDSEIKSRIINPRRIETISVNLLKDKNGKNKHQLISNYDLEIFPMSDIANVICNIKTKMTWDFEIDNQQDFYSPAFAESLLHHFVNQINFVRSILREHFMNDYATPADLFKRPNIKELYAQLKKEFNFLFELNLPDQYPFLFSYWY